MMKKTIKKILREFEDDFDWIRDVDMGEPITNLKSGDHFKIVNIDGNSLEDYNNDNDLSEIDPYTTIFRVVSFTRIKYGESSGFINSDTYREMDTDVFIKPLGGVGGWVSVDNLFVKKYNFKK